MPFEYAGFEMAYDLMRIWSDAFPQDNADDIRKFITLALKTYNCAVWKEDGHPVSMAFTLPAVLELKSGSLNLCYIYAAATLTEYRGQGLFARLLGNVQEQLANNGVDACFLRPASPRLFDYYGRLGYKPFFYFISENLSSDNFPLGWKLLSVTKRCPQTFGWNVRRSVRSLIPDNLKFPCLQMYLIMI
jgi:predicted acetyltransferase